MWVGGICRTLLPSPCTVEDGNTLLGLLPCLKKNAKSGGHSILCNTIVCSTKFIEGCGDVFKDLLREKAQTVSQASKKQLLEASRGNSGNSDAGSAERSTSSRASTGDSSSDKDRSRKEKRKDKKAKKGGRGGEDHDEGPASATSSSGRTANDQWVFLSPTEIQDVLAKNRAHADCDDAMLSELAAILYCITECLLFHVHVRDLAFCILNCRDGCKLVVLHALSLTVHQSCLDCRFVQIPPCTQCISRMCSRGIPGWWCKFRQEEVQRQIGRRVLVR